ncbi:MAG: methyltransferase domain-containing protein [Planctomycetota bacterium]
MSDYDSTTCGRGGIPHHSGWESYWDTAPRGARRIYSVIASIYRQMFICPRLAWWLCRTYPKGCSLLHAGCGSGEVDSLINTRFQITGLDISPKALERYLRNNPNAAAAIHADLMQMDGVGNHYEGVYSLGVLEHFTPEEIRHILRGLKRAVRPGGRMIAFWPLADAVSVKFLGFCHRALNRSGRPTVELHPPEITLLRSRKHAEELIHAAGWRLLSYSVSPFDLFIQAVLVCEPLTAAPDCMAGITSNLSEHTTESAATADPQSTEASTVVMQADAAGDFVKGKK